MLKKVILLVLAMALITSSFVFADDSQSTLSKITGLSDQEIQSLYQNRTGYGKILTASILAKMTNTNIKDIVAANQAGSSFAKIAEDKGIKLEDYKNAVLKERSTYIDEQVKAGIITEAQANLIKARMQQRIQACEGQGYNLSQGNCVNGRGAAGKNQRGHRNVFKNGIINR